MLLTTIILLLVVFVTGLLLGRSLSGAEIDDINKFMRDNELNTESFLIEQELIGSFEENCGLASKRVNDLFLEQVQIGRLLSSEDAEKRLGDDNYRFLKKKYHLMQIRTYIMFKRLIDNCNETAHVVLYYYSRDEPESLQQGLILDRLVQENDISVFAIEYNFSKELVFLESSYGITTTPALVIDYDTRLEGLIDHDYLAEILED